MKKLFSCLLVLGLIASLAAAVGCGSSATTKAETGTSGGTNKNTGDKEKATGDKEKGSKGGSTP